MRLPVSRRILCASWLSFSALCLATPSLTHATEPKRVIVVTVTAGFRHSSIETAERILQKLATESQAFTIVETLRQPNIVIPKKPTAPKALPADADDNAKKRFAADTARYQEAMAKWTPEMEAEMKKAQDDTKSQMTETLKKLSPAALDEAKIDGLIFANTTGDLPLPDKEGLIQWVEKGHAFMGMHSATDTLRMFPGYTSMIGGEFAGHGSQAALELTAMDPKHPATAGLTSPWSITQEEFYHFKGYEKARVHDLWSSPKFPMDKKPDQGKEEHFPVSWVRTQGTGKIFYTSLGHREDIWDDGELPNRINPPEIAKAYQKHILGGIRWALGLAEGSAEPGK